MARYLTLQNLSDTSVTSGDLIGQIGFAASNDSDGGDAIAICSSISVKAEGTFDASNNPGAIIFSTAPSNGPTDRLKVTNEGHFTPVANLSYDLGSSPFHFRNLYVSGIYFDGVGPQTLPFSSFNVAANTDTVTVVDGNTVTFTGLGNITVDRSSQTIRISGSDGGGGGTPGGSDTHVQFNDGGSTFGGNAGFTYDKTAQKMYSRSYYTNITDSGNITSSVTLDLDQSNFHQVTLSGNPITINVANADIGQRFIIRLKQDNTGSRTVNWFSTISWPGGGPPALSTSTGVADLLGFVATASNEYDGFLMVSGIY
jgi:hypothetical protein